MTVQYSRKFKVKESDLGRPVVSNPFSMLNFDEDSVWRDLDVAHD